MKRIEYWRTSEGIHVVEIDSSDRAQFKLLRVLHLCEAALKQVGWFGPRTSEAL